MARITLITLWRGYALILTAAFLAAFTSTSFAQSSASAGLKGRVLNSATQQFLDQADVRIEGANRQTLTDREGYYAFSNLEPGVYTVAVTYTGLEPVKKTVEVQSGKTAQLDLELTSDVYRMTEFVVAGELEGDAYAANRRKKSEHMMEAISSDTFGSVTEGNAGEFLKNLPGIQIEYNAADARTIRVRGQEDFLTNVAVDGVQYASASSSNSTRAFEVDQVSINNIETIEVYKAPPPSESPAIGGMVNLVTKSAFLQKGRRLTLASSLNVNSEDITWSKTPGPGSRETRKLGLGGSLAYSEAFFNHTLGVSLSLAESNQHNEQHSVTKGYTYPGATGRITPTTPGYLSLYQILDGPKFANRRNAGLNFDYKLSDSTTVAFRNTFNAYEANIRDRTFRLRGNTPQPGYTVTDVTFTPGNNVFVDSGESWFDKNSKDWSSRFAVRHKLADYTITYDAGYSKSTNHYKSPVNRFFRGVSAELRNIGYHIVIPEDGPAPTLIQQTAGPDIYNFANYTIPSRIAATTDRTSEDLIMSGRLDVRRDFVNSRHSFYLQSGYSWRRQERTILRPDPDLLHVGPDGVVGGTDDALPLQRLRETSYTVSPGFDLRPFPWGSPVELARYRNQFPLAFIEGTLADANFIRRMTNDRFFSETVQATYVMGNVKLGRLNVMTGARIEFTDFVAKDYQRDLSIDLVRQQFSRRTTNVDYRSPIFRNLQLRYTLTPDLLARASFTDGQGRQNFSDLVPSTNFNDDTREISQNNAGLRPRFSENYDASLEYYMKPVGLISVGWFKKSIRNYTTNDEILLGPDNEFGDPYVGWTLVTRKNAGNAEYEGAEADFRHQLKYLPGWLRGLEVFGNYTTIYNVKGDFGGTATVTELPGLITESFNTGIRFTTPRRKLFLQAKENYRGKHLRSSGTNPTYNVTDQTWDFDIRYVLSRTFEVELAVRNAFVKARRVSQYGGARYVNWNEYGAQYSLILRARL